MYALKKQRKRQRRKAHANKTDQRNRDRGFTSSDLHRNGDSEAKAKAASMVGRKAPSYHKPVRVAAVIEPPTTMPEIMSTDIFDALKTEARTKRKSFKKVAEVAGWKLILLTGDPKKPSNWSR